MDVTEIESDDNTTFDLAFPSADKYKVRNYGRGDISLKHNQFLNIKHVH